MRVEIRDHDGLIGVVVLLEGRAVPDAGARAVLEGLVVVEPGDPRHRLTYEDGAEYIEALQHNLRGTYVWATAPTE